MFLWKNKKPGLKLFEFAEVGNFKKENTKRFKVVKLKLQKFAPGMSCVFFVPQVLRVVGPFFWHLEELKKKTGRISPQIKKVMVNGRV